MKRNPIPLMPVIWGATCLIIGGLVAIGLHGYKATEEAVATQFNTQQLMLAQQAARGIENFLTAIRETTTTLTRLPEVQIFTLRGACRRKSSGLYMKASREKSISQIFLKGLRMEG